MREQITLGGDSAGGNLALAVLSHLLHPHSQIEPLRLSSPLNVAFLLSPWVSFNTDRKSFQTNAERDMFDHHPLELWSGAFLAGAKSGDNYSEPCRAPPSWWEGMDKVVSEVLIWGGEWEVLIDSIREFEAIFRKGYDGKCHAIYGEKAMHEDMIVDVLMGYKTKSKTALDVEDWIRAKL
jgi:acetyl esterase/lipase